MYEKKVFRIEYPTGHMDLNVGSFFGTATQKGIQKALRLCKRDCPDSRRQELIDKPRAELEQTQQILNHLDSLENERITTLEELGLGYDLREKTPLERRVQARMAKLTVVMRDLMTVDEKERWKG